MFRKLTNSLCTLWNIPSDGTLAKLAFGTIGLKRRVLTLPLAEVVPRASDDTSIIVKPVILYGPVGVF